MIHSAPLSLRSISAAFLAIVIFPGASQLCASELDLAALEKGLVHQSLAEGGRFDLPHGAMIYQSENTEHYTKGYRPEAITYVNGDLARELYDMPAQFRSRGVFVDVVSALESAGFKPLYRCEREACGEADAWRFYLSPMVGGRSETQYYFAGSAGGQSYVAVYVNELGGQVRVLVDHLLERPVVEVGSKAVSSPLFAPGSARLASHAATSLSGLSETMKAAKSGESFVLIGHADSRGNMLRNLLLSGARAQAVKDLLVSEKAVDAAKIDIAAFGYADPANRRRAIAARDADRRVELRVISPRSNITVEDGKTQASLN